MGWTGEWSRRLRMLLNRGKFRRDLEDEMRLHVELRREQQMVGGLDAKTAQQAAMRRFGNTTRIAEKSTMAWGWNWLETFLQDAGYGIRAMLRTPAITIVALLSLALGIGANTAIFSFLDAVMLRSLPVKDPQQLEMLGEGNMAGITQNIANTGLYSYPFYRQFQSKNAVFADTAAIFSMTNHVHGFVDERRDTELINVKMVSGNYFQTLGVGAQIGRVLDENDDSGDGDHPIAVISDGFWKRSLGGDPGVLHHTIRLGEKIYNIVGVAPAEFFGTTVGEAPDTWVPLSMTDYMPPGWGGHKDNFSESLFIFGRLKPGVSIAQATANVNVLFRQIRTGFPDAKLTQENQALLARSHVPLSSMAQGLSALRGTYSEPLKILMITVGLVLLIACANIANLLLARSTVRARELALRQALGAHRLRIIRQLLTESLVLALSGGVLGIGLAAVANRILLRMISNGRDTIPLNVSLNLNLLAFATAITVLTALLFGTLPALRATRLDLSTSLKSGTTARGRASVAKLLVVGQVAFSLVLMMAACLFLRTLNNLSHVDVGFNKENILRLDIDSSALGLHGSDARANALYHEIEDRVSGLPGVKGASFSAFTFAEGSWNGWVTIPGMPIDRKINVNHNVIGNDYFKVMQIPLVAGRVFGSQDTASSQHVAIIGERMARYLFPDESAVGRVFLSGVPGERNPPEQELVVGVVKDVKFRDLEAPDLYIDYLPYNQSGWGFGDLEVRYIGSYSAVAKEVQETIHAINRNLPITNVTTMDAQIARSYTNQTIIAELSTFFGVLALFLSCIGLYGLMSYMVSRRTSEIGIRIALGASRAEVGLRVLREVIIWVVVGVALGLPVMLGGERLVGKMLYGLSGTDPVSLAAAVLMLALAGLVAGYLPARRASRINPVIALRHE